MSLETADYLSPTSSSFREYIRVLFRQKMVIFVSFAVVLGTVILGLQLKTPMYESQVKMLISGVKETGTTYYKDIGIVRESSIGLTQSEMVTSMPVLEQTVLALRLDRPESDTEKDFASPLKRWFLYRRLKMIQQELTELDPELGKVLLFRSSIEDLRSKIQVEPLRDTNLFVIRVKDYNPVQSAIIANVISRSYVIFDLKQLLAELQLKYGPKHPVIRQIQDNIEKMKSNLSGHPLEELDAIGAATVKIIEQAVPAIEPSGPRKLVILFLAFFMGIFLGVMLAFIFEYVDQTVKSSHDAEMLLKIPELGSIPKKKYSEHVLLSNIKSKSVYTTAYNNLSDQIRLMVKDKKLKTILITATETHEGASTIIANIAFYLAYHAMQKVLIIDANLRDSSMQHIFKIERSPGLADVLEDKITLKETTQALSSHLHIVPAGRTNLNPTNLLDSNHMADVLKDAKKGYDVVLIDCANLRNYKDARVLTPSLDGMILIVSEGKTRRHIIENSVMPFKMQKVNILGFILNNRTFVIPRFLYERI